MVLSYSEKDKRKLFARIMGHDNYGELDVVDNDPEDLVSSIACIHDGVCGGKKPCRPVEHVFPWRGPLLCSESRTWAR